VVLDHENYMKRAIELALKVPELPFGAVIVDSQSRTIVSEGWNRTSINPLLHGEIDAIDRLAESRAVVDWGRLVLYTTAESCPMCQAAALWSGIGMVVYGTSIPTLQRLGWKQIDLRSEEVVRRSPFAQCILLGGILERECDALFEAALRAG
jgi:tRNA(adenine34) deaminase